MPLGFKAFGLGFHAAGVFLVEFPFRFQRALVRSNVFPAFGSIFGGCTSRYPGKDAGGYRSTDAGTVLSGKEGTYLVYGGEPALRHSAHYLINLPRCRDNTGARTPPLAHLLSDFNNPGQIFVLGQLFPPALAHFSHGLPPPYPIISAGLVILPAIALAAATAGLAR